MSVTLPLTAEFLSIGDLELAQVKKVGYGAIARINDEGASTIDFMEVQPRDIQQYQIPDGKIPFSEWLESLP